VASALQVPVRPAPDLPEGLVLCGPFDVEGSEEWRAGAVMPQSRGSMAVARELAPQAGERVLDLCAAPGAKTTHIAALLGDRGEVVAVERHGGRAAALERTCARMHVGCVRVEVADAAAWKASQPFDRVLVDPPCSGLGTLQSRPDIRWRGSPAQIAELAEVQRRILDAGAAATAPGGVLVYSVCTISRAEGDELIDAFLAGNHEFAEEHRIQLLPHRDGTDGFFIARLRRDGG
jgi:16S rRNA (cytosine967-C5)-methyltransferase